MSCYKPLLALPTQELTSSGKRKFVPVGAYERYKDFDPFIAFPGAIKIPCGQCRGCRMQNMREWADRMIIELDHSKKAVFLTLTYNDDHIPLILDRETGELVGTLCKRDLTNFFKRLRKQFPDKEIRYYATGEYGEHTKRPHVHIILFGFSLDDFNFNKLADPEHRFDIYYSRVEWQGKNELGQDYYRCDWLSEAVWQNGFVCLSDVSWKTCAYVARYVKKKDMGLVQDAFKSKKDIREPEYSVMSRNPGIGMYYPKEHEDTFEKSVYYFNDQDGVTKVKMPGAFMRYLYMSDRVKYNEMKEERQKYSSDHELSKLLQTDLTSMELNDMYEESQKKSLEVLDFYRGL